MVGEQPHTEKQGMTLPHSNSGLPAAALWPQQPARAVLWAKPAMG